MKVALLLGLLVLPQEDVEALIRQLGDESIEVRERATGAILKLGEKARDALERAAASGTPELKARASSILKSLNRVRELRAWVIPPTQVTLSGEMTLREAAESIEKQGGLKSECASWPEGKFRIELKDVPFWKALEEICRASGRRALMCDATGPKLVGDRHEEIPSTVAGIFRLQSAGVAERRTINFDTGADEKTLTIFLKLGYENPKRPFRVYVSLDSLKDDQGNELVGGFRQHLTFAPKYEQTTTPAEKPLFALALELKSSEIPKPETAKIVRLSGSITVYFGASEETMRMPKQEGAAEWAPVLEVLDDTQVEPIIGLGNSGLVTPRGGELQCRVKFKSFDHRLVCLFGDIWNLRDGSDKLFPGSAGVVSSLDPQAPELTLFFQNAEPTGGIRSIEVGIPRRLIRKDIHFELKDIRIR